MGARLGQLGHHKVPALSPRCIWHMGTMQDLEDTIYSPCVKCRSQKNHRSLTWWLIDVCGSSAILLAVHRARTTIEPLQRVSDKYRPTGSDQQEDLATLGSVQLRQTSELWLHDCLEKGHYSRQMATYCGHSNASAEYRYALCKKKKRATTVHTLHNTWNNMWT